MYPNLTFAKFIVVLTFHLAAVKCRRLVVAGTPATIPITSRVSVCTELFVLPAAFFRCWIFKLVVVKTIKFKGKPIIIRRRQRHQRCENAGDNNPFMSHSDKLFEPNERLQGYKLAVKADVKMCNILSFPNSILSQLK